MRAIVRLLPRLFFVGIAAVALVVLAERAQDADAETPASDLATASATPALTAAQSPLPTLPPPPALLASPSVPAPPVTSPLLPSTSTVPAASAVTSLASPPERPADFSTALMPIPPSQSDVPADDAAVATDAVGGPPAVPSFAPPELPLPLPLPVPPNGTLPDPTQADPAPPAPGPIQIGVAPTAPTTAATSPDLAPDPVPPDRTEQSTLVATDIGGAFANFANRNAPARAPPADPPGDPCPGRGTPRSARADLAGVLTPYGGDATRRARLAAGAYLYTSSSLLDPLLRPD